MSLETLRAKILEILGPMYPDLAQLKADEIIKLIKENERIDHRTLQRPGKV